MSKIPEKFCKAPFGSLTIDTDGALLPCCEFIADRSNLPKLKLNGSYSTYENYWNCTLDSLRKSMLEGKTDGGCLHCLKKENHDPASSHRWVANRRIKDSYDDFKKVFDSNKKFKPKMIELRLGNLCNLKCIMCGPYASSSLMAEYKKHKQTFNDFGIGADMSYEITGNWFKNQTNRDIIFQLVSGATFLNFGGGEPLMNPYIKEILQKVSSDVPIAFNSNLTNLSDEVIDQLSKFESVRFNVSLDGIGKHHEYLRYGSNWEIIKKNIAKLKKLTTVEVVITYILQHTSIYTLFPLLDFVEREHLELLVGNVYDASGRLTLNTVLQNDLNDFSSEVNKKQFKQREQVLNWIASYQYDNDLHLNFRKYFELLDSIRNTSFVKTFNPSWA